MTGSVITLLKKTVELMGSDLHILVGSLPTFRLNGKLVSWEEGSVTEIEDVERWIGEIVNAEQKERLLKEKEIDLSFDLPGVARFRVNIYTQKGTYAMAFRVVPKLIRSVDDWGLPSICHKFAQLRQGFILVVGPTGHGKSTTLASIIEEINQNRYEHIISVEDPIEFVYESKKSIISQRELGGDTNSWGVALKSVLREDPDVVLVGEMRDPDTMAAAITLAETGHLVFATLHTNSASQTVDRIIDSFPEHQQDQVRTQLASTLEAVLSQRLVPTLDGKRAVATEVLVATPAVRNSIRESKVHQIDNIISTSGEFGMYLLENSLAELVGKGLLDPQVANTYAVRPTVLSRLLSK